MQNHQKESPAAAATRRENTIPVSDGGSQKSREKEQKCPYEDSHDGLPCGYCGQTTNVPTVPDKIKDIQRIRIAKAAKDPQAEKLLNGIFSVEGYIKDLRKRRSGRMWTIAMQISRLFLQEGVTTTPGKGQHLDEASWVELAFSQGEYTDAKGKRRPQRWGIIIESRHGKSEGECPACGGEIETEILEDNSYRVGCDDCGYEHSPFCGVGVDE